MTHRDRIVTSASRTRRDIRRCTPPHRPPAQRTPPRAHHPRVRQHTPTNRTGHARTLRGPPPTVLASCRAASSAASSCPPLRPAQMQSVAISRCGNLELLDLTLRRTRRWAYAPKLQYHSSIALLENFQTHFYASAANFNQVRGEIGSCRKFAEIDQYRPNIGRNRVPRKVETKPSLVKLNPNSNRVWSKPIQVWSTSAHVCPRTWSNRRSNLAPATCEVAQNCSGEYASSNFGATSERLPRERCG